MLLGDLGGVCDFSKPTASLASSRVIKGFVDRAVGLFGRFVSTPDNLNSSSRPLCSLQTDRGTRMETNCRRQPSRRSDGFPARPAARGRRRPRQRPAESNASIKHTLAPNLPRFVFPKWPAARPPGCGAAGRLGRAPCEMY